MIDAKTIETFRILSEKTEGNKAIVARLLADPDAMRAHCNAHRASIIARIEAAKKRLGMD